MSASDIFIQILVFKIIWFGYFCQLLSKSRVFFVNPILFQYFTNIDEPVITAYYIQFFVLETLYKESPVSKAVEIDHVFDFNSGQTARRTPGQHQSENAIDGLVGKERCMCVYVI